ncbi:MAG: DUF3095 family protein, partial [Candidatus Omnitrophica bacterium]|nr:DUF3095 family protein [Candidatus Omnitrophota bacterium]
MPAADFYSELRSFDNFRGISNDANFLPVPPDWRVVLTDVKGSTVAIEAGRYKDVNTIGAAAIAVSRHAMRGRDFPYVFGGDGATMLIPPDEFDRVTEALIGLKRLSREKFGFQLRVGAVEVGELTHEGTILEVAKFEIGQGRCVAFFRGGAVTLAEKKIKGDTARYELYEPLGRPELPVELKGLSCRWNPIPNKSGKMLSILVVAKSSDPAHTYRIILDGLDRIFEGEFHRANPVNLSAMIYKSMVECVREEKRYHRPLMTPSFLYRMFEIVAAV